MKTKTKAKARINPNTKPKPKANAQKTNPKASGRDPKTGRFLKGHKFSSEPTKWTEEKALELGEGLVKWMQDDMQNYMIGEYLIQHNLWKDVVAYLSERYPRFADYITRAKEIEASRIKMLALRNILNPGMAQWVLAVHHNQHNVQKTEVTGKDGAPIAPPVINIQPVTAKKDKDNE